MKQTKSRNAQQRSSGSISLLIYGAMSVTLYFNTKASDPFNTPKLALALVICGWLLGHIFQSIRTNTIKIKSLDFFLLGTVTLFLLATAVALVFTDILVVGLLGDTQRRNGLLFYICMSIFYLFTALKFNYKFIIKLLKNMVILGLVLGMYGYIQTSGNDFVTWDNPHNSMIATVGNPNFASSLLAILALISLFSLFLDEFTYWQRLISVTVVILALYAIFQSNSRQGLLVFGLGSLTYVSIYSYFEIKKLRLIAPFLSLLVLVLAIIGMLQKGPLAQYLYKESVSVRGFYWKAAVDMFKDYPLTGVGIDSYLNYFKQYRSAEYPKRFGYEITSSNAHNVFLQFFSTGGLILGLSYLFILVFVMIVSVKLIKNSKENVRKLAIVLAATWVAWLSQSLISIDNIGVAIWGWILGGAILALYRTEIYQQQDVSSPSNSGKIIEIFQPIASILILIPVVVIVFFLHRQETDLFIAKNAFLQQPAKKDIVDTYSTKVLENPLSDPYYKFEAAAMIGQLGNPEVAKKEINNLYLLDKRNLVYLNWLVRYEINRENFSQAVSITNEIAKYDPHNAKNYLLLGQLYKTLGDEVNMNIAKDKVLSLARDNEIGKQAEQELN